MVSQVLYDAQYASVVVEALLHVMSKQNQILSRGSRGIAFGFMGNALSFESPPWCCCALDACLCMPHGPTHHKCQFRRDNCRSGNSELEQVMAHWLCMGEPVKLTKQLRYTASQEERTSQHDSDQTHLSNWTRFADHMVMNCRNTFGMMEIERLVSPW